MRSRKMQIVFRGGFFSSSLFSASLFKARRKGKEMILYLSCVVWKDILILNVFTKCSSSHQGLWWIPLPQTPELYDHMFSILSEISSVVSSNIAQFLWTPHPKTIWNWKRTTSTVHARASLSRIVNQSLPKSSERPVMLSSINGTIVSRVSKRAFPFRYHRPGQTGNRMSSITRVPFACFHGE